MRGVGRWQHNDDTGDDRWPDDPILDENSCGRESFAFSRRLLPTQFPGGEPSTDPIYEVTDVAVISEMGMGLSEFLSALDISPDSLKSLSYAPYRGAYDQFYDDERYEFGMFMVCRGCVFSDYYLI